MTKLHDGRTGEEIDHDINWSYASIIVGVLGSFLIIGLMWSIKP